MRFTAQIRGNGAPGKSLEVTVNLPGLHNVQNALAAIAVAIELQIPEAAIVRLIAGGPMNSARSSEPVGAQPASDRTSGAAPVRRAAPARKPAGRFFTR